MTNLVSKSAGASSHQLYRERDITSRGKFSKAHLYNMVAKGEFPKQVITAPRFSRWGHEVDEWFADPTVWITAHSKTQPTPKTTEINISSVMTGGVK